MTDFSDEMLIFCFLSDGLLNQMLQGLRKAGVYIPLKAVLTPSNCMWNSYMMHREIAKEHEMMHQTRDNWIVWNTEFVFPARPWAAPRRAIRAPKNPGRCTRTPAPVTLWKDGTAI